MSDDAALMELRAMEADFGALSRRWGLRDRDVVALLGRGDARETEESMRVLLELDRVMRALFGEDGVAAWLREEGPRVLSPMGFLALGQDERRAMLHAARLRHLQVLGYEA